MQTSPARLAGAALAALLGSALAAEPVAAQSVALFANLTTDQEPHAVNPTLTTGGPRPIPYGFATFFLNAERTSLIFTATIYDIDLTGAQTADANDNLLAAHIHASPTLVPGASAGVVWGFFGAPFNDVNPNDVVVTPFASGVGGTISGKWDAPEGQNTTLALQIPNLLNERAYMNFHTAQHPAGEIRGTLQVVPEPGTFLLLGSGLVALGLGVRRRRGRSPLAIG